MQADRRYDLLFEPVRIGPKVAPNRFFQVPHCNGMGHLHPSAMARMREVKAQGGWGVVSTEECEIHPSAELSPDIEARLWDDRDIPALARMAEAVQRHGSLAAIELAYNGHAAANRTSRLVPFAPVNLPARGTDPWQARGMSKADIRALRGWHRAAALRACTAGFDIVYVYAAHQLTLPMHFLLRRYNDRTDEYGGSLENRARLLRELIEDTKDAIGDRCAVAVRLAVDELLGPDGMSHDGEAPELIAMLAELPDLWDVNVSHWGNDSVSSRFGTEGAQEPYVSFVKALTTKPVVGVGWFTSPDAMLSQVRRGVLDLIGAARPSIADPFLPNKIRAGRLQDLRECIGCNICVSGDMTRSPIRCTQNPTMGEEWRRNWHPEIVPPASQPTRVLVVGAGPAGLECARILGQRGFEVALAERDTQAGGRVLREARLPGLAAWARVVQYRLGQLAPLGNVTQYLGHELDAAEILELGFAQVILATGSRWRGDGVGRLHRIAIPGVQGVPVLTPDALMAGARPHRHALVYDDDHYYMAGVLAELLVRDGHEVTFVTPATDVSAWTHNTLEQERIQRRLLELGVRIITARQLVAVAPGAATLACIYTGRTQVEEFGTFVPVTSRDPLDALYLELNRDPARLHAAGIERVSAIGDCWAPATIAAAVYAGHKAAREIDGAVELEQVLRELPALGPWQPLPTSARTSA